MSDEDRVVRVYYDFASTLCYVAHRLMGRMGEELDELGIDLEWSPLDLSFLLGWTPGREVPELRRANAARVARDLGVEVRVPRLWPDARAADAAALLLDDPAAEATWRERAFSAVFEEGRDLGSAEAAAALAAELDLSLPAADIAEAGEELERRTQLAAAEEVTGVPTFMLDAWPFGGIQEERTMSSIFRRWLTRRERSRRSS